MSTFKKTLIILFVTMGLASCDLLTQVAQMANFANCKFNFDSVDQIEMLGVNLADFLGDDVLQRDALAFKQIPNGVVQ